MDTEDWIISLIIGVPLVLLIAFGAVTIADSGNVGELDRQAHIFCSTNGYDDALGRKSGIATFWSKYIWYECTDYEAVK